MDIQTIILCGGAGTRLLSELSPRTPKFLCPISDQELLGDRILRYLINQGCRRIIFATGHLHDEIVEFVNREYGEAFDSIIFSREVDPLGTGGAIANATRYLYEEDVFVINGDTIHRDSLDEMRSTHRLLDADMTILTASVKDISDQGVIGTNKDSRIMSFDEKSQSGSGLVNAGVYLCKTSILRTIPGGKLSFERDVIPDLIYKDVRIFAHLGSQFYDVGTPTRLAEVRKKC